MGPWSGIFPSSLKTTARLAAKLTPAASLGQMSLDLATQMIRHRVRVTAASRFDNNGAECALRAVMGRHNYLFPGSDSGGERSAAIYTLIGSAKLNSVDPEACLSTMRHASPITPSTASTSSCPGNLSLSHS